MADNNMIYLIHWEDAKSSGSKDVKVSKVESGLTVAESLTSFAGDVIHEWSSPQDGREAGGLPALTPGGRYFLRIFENEQPKKSVSFRITFYDDIGEVLSYQEMKKKSISFRFPENAASYSVSAIHNGYKKLFFHHMEICRVEDNITGQLLNANPEKKVANVVFLDPEEKRLVLPSKEVLGNICNLLVISGTTQPSLELQSAEQKLPGGFAGFRKVNFVGAGDKSCDLAVKFSRKYGNGHAYRFKEMIG